MGVYNGWVWNVINHVGLLIIDGCALGIARRGETTHSGVDVNNTHPSMINPDYNMILANLTLNYQYFAY